MRRLLCIFIGCFCLAFPLLAQSNKLIKELESKRGALQKQITESETLLKTTKKTVSVAEILRKSRQRFNND